jgi:hypothetical protein
MTPAAPPSCSSTRRGAQRRIPPKGRGAKRRVPPKAGLAAGVAFLLIFREF